MRGVIPYSEEFLQQIDISLRAAKFAPSPKSPNIDHAFPTAYVKN